MSPEFLPGVSITDACIGWETTEALLIRLDARLASAGRRS
jgi:phospho-2-dehydro-3-deoxyheptonate aldolase